MLSHFGPVRLFAPLWTVVCQAPMDSKNTGVGCQASLQDVFLTQGSKPSLLWLLHRAKEFFTAKPPGKPQLNLWKLLNKRFSFVTTAKKKKKSQNVCCFICSLTKFKWMYGSIHSPGRWPVTNTRALHELSDFRERGFLSHIYFLISIYLCFFYFKLVKKLTDTFH